MIVDSAGTRYCGQLPGEVLDPFAVVFCTRQPDHPGGCSCDHDTVALLLCAGYTLTPTPDEPPEGTMTENHDQLGETARAVLAYLRLAGPSTTTEVAEVLDMTTDSVGSCLRRLEDAGHATRRHSPPPDHWVAHTEVDVTLDQLLDAIGREYAAEQEAREVVDAQVHRVGYLLDLASGQRAMPKAAERLGMSTAGAWQRLQSWRKAQEKAGQL